MLVVEDVIKLLLRHLRPCTRPRWHSKPTHSSDIFIFNFYAAYNASNVDSYARNVLFGINGRYVQAF